MKNSLYILLFAVFLLSACAAPGAETQPESLPADPSGSTMPALTDPSQPITVQSGETFMVVVESNPSTGYHWEMIGPLDDTHLEFVSREYTGSEPGIPGSGGVEVWTLKAVAAGDASFVLGSYPPGDGVSYEQELRFTINIE